VTILRTTPNKFYRQGIDSPEQHANGAGDKALSDGGWQNSPVARTLPVELTRSTQPTFIRAHAKANLAVSGAQSPITRFSGDTALNELQWLELPEVADVQLTGDVKPGANVLLNATVGSEERPLLTHQRYGAGNTYLLATSGTWRWQMQMPSLTRLESTQQQPMQIKPVAGRLISLPKTQTALK